MVHLQWGQPEEMTYSSKWVGVFKNESFDLLDQKMARFGRNWRRIPTMNTGYPLVKLNLISAWTECTYCFSMLSFSREVYINLAIIWASDILSEGKLRQCNLICIKREYLSLLTVNRGWDTSWSILNALSVFSSTAWKFGQKPVQKAVWYKMMLFCLFCFLVFQYCNWKRMLMYMSLH